MENLRVGVLVLLFWVFAPRASRAEGFLYLPIIRTPVITAGFCGYRTASGACHGGIDYDVRDDGDGIIAAAEGVVEVVADGWSNTRRDNIVSYGNSVRVRHPNGYLTIYGHLKSGTLLVRVGDHVRIGSSLGVGDNSGWSTGSHLHFEVRDPSNHKVDPYGDSPRYPNCGANTLWVSCPPVSPADVDRDRDGWNMLTDCDDGNADVHPFATERCNGRDDDCDTILDNWGFLGVACTVEPASGCIRNGMWVCSSDETTIVCNADTTVGVERCDNVDNDCDAETDEDWRTGPSRLGQYCEVGRGMCLNSGVYVCAPDGRGVICNATPLLPGVEYCNGVDDDCDGTIDDSCTSEPISTYCCDGRGTIRGPSETWCVQLSGALPSELWANWDDTTCAVNGAGIRIGESCDGYGICAFQNFYGVCGWHCTSHASFCLNDRDHAYCTKQCGTDLDCPSPLTCQATHTLDSTTVNLCREVY